MGSNNKMSTATDKNKEKGTGMSVARAAFVAIAAVGLFLRSYYMQAAAFMLIIGFVGLAVCYLIMAIRSVKTDLLLTMMYVGVSTCLWSLLAVLAGWGNLMTVLFVGVGVVLLSLVLMGIRSLRKKR